MASSAIATSTKVFSIPELLATILHHASPKDLLLWQRINTTFQATIQTPPFQQKLFFNLESRPNVTKAVDRTTAWNPFMNVFERTSDTLSRGDSVDIKLKTFRALDYPLASWKNMFVANPALAKGVFMMIHMTLERETIARTLPPDVLMGGLWEIYQRDVPR